MTTPFVERQPVESFRHDALLYSGPDGFLAGTVQFIREAVAAGDPVLVVVGAAKIGLLRSALGGDASAVRFADMAEVGGNPARILPAWLEFAQEHAGGTRRPRGIGEPVYAERSSAETAECELHESLLNLAFADSPPWWLRCPYDVEALKPSVVDRIRHTHPLIVEDGASWSSPDYAPIEAPEKVLDGPLPEPPQPVPAVDFTSGPLEPLRRFVALHAADTGMTAARVADLVLAVNELAANSLRHGGGGGTLRVWRSDGALVCEVVDGGQVAEPLVGRTPPPTRDSGGRGLWLVNQLCDLVQLRSTAHGTRVRVHMYLG